MQRFNGSSERWPEFIENFKKRVHEKTTFDDNTRMERLLSVLEGDAKKAVQSIGVNGIFYASALKALKRDFGNPVVVSQLKLKSLLEQPQIASNDKISLRRFHQQLSTTNTWLKTMGYKSALISTENLAKAVARLPHYLRNQFYKNSAGKISIEGGMNLIDFERWLENKLKEHFNPISALINDFEKRDKPPSNKSGKLPNDSYKVRTYTTQHSTKTSSFKCFVSDQNHKLVACNDFKEKPVELRRKIVLENKLCFNCLSKKNIE